MDTDTLLERLTEAVMLESNYAAIRIRAQYAPQAGWDAKVYPATYSAREPNQQTGPKVQYHVEERWAENGEPVKVVVLDSYQSQANRAEAALKDHHARLGLPEIVMEYADDDRRIRISNFDAPHRSRDAYFLDSGIDDTEIGRALNSATAESATAYLKWVPCELIYGVWDSHRGKRSPLKFPRAYTSEMTAWQVMLGKRAATKTDPLVLKGDDKVSVSEWRSGTTAKEKKLSELGHGMVPGKPTEEAGGVTARALKRNAVLSLTSLARYRFPVDASRDATAAGRTALAALALLADRLAFGVAGLHLRSGADLVLQDEHIEWVRGGAEPEPLELSRKMAEELFDLAKGRLAEAGVLWAYQPLELTPSDPLKQKIENALVAVDLDPE